MKTLILLTMLAALCACAPKAPQLIDIVLPDGTVMLVPLESAHIAIRQDFKP